MFKKPLTSIKKSCIINSTSGTTKEKTNPQNKREQNAARQPYMINMIKKQTTIIIQKEKEKTK